MLSMMITYKTLTKKKNTHDNETDKKEEVKQNELPEPLFIIIFCLRALPTSTQICLLILSPEALVCGRSALCLDIKSVRRIELPRRALYKFDKSIQVFLLLSKKNKLSSFFVACEMQIKGQSHNAIYPFAQGIVYV